MTAEEGTGTDEWSQPILSEPAQPVGPEPRWTQTPIDSRVWRLRTGYVPGAEQRWSAKVVVRAADVAVAALPMPLRVLDVGCGTGRLLGEFVERVPYADAYVGVDPLPGPLREARRVAGLRVGLVRAAAEALPFADGSFDLVVTTMSFAYWADPRAGAAELARVVAATGKVVLVDATGSNPRRKGRVRRPRDVRAVLEGAGLSVQRLETVRRNRLFVPQVRAFIASP